MAKMEKKTGRTAAPTARGPVAAVAVQAAAQPVRRGRRRTPRTEEAQAVDRHVGGRLRELRLMRGLSQQSLSRAIGLTFQQLQKYERGTNRISASVLWELAHQLDVPITVFFDGLEGWSKPAEELPAASLKSARLAARIDRLPDELSSRIRDLVESLTRNAQPN